MDDFDDTVDQTNFFNNFVGDPSKDPLYEFEESKQVSNNISILKLDDSAPLKARKGSEMKRASLLNKLMKPDDLKRRNKKLGSSKKVHSFKLPGIDPQNKSRSRLLRPSEYRPKDPDTYIKRLFGKDFEFSEKFLASNIDPQIIIKAIKKRYRFQQVTRIAVKHVLYEGARSNNILRIDDECYNKMIDILDLPLDDDKDDSELKEAFDTISHSSKSILKLPDIFHPRDSDTVKGKEEVQIHPNQHDLNTISEKERESKMEKTSEAPLITPHTDDLMRDSYSDIFYSTVDMLKQIIQMETQQIEVNNVERSKKGVKKKLSVFPDHMSVEDRKAYFKLKRNYKDNLDLLLSIRSKFSKKLLVDILLSTMGSQEPIEPEANDWGMMYGAEDIVEIEATKMGKCVDLRRDYIKKLIIIVMVSLICFAIYAVGVYFFS